MLEENGIVVAVEPGVAWVETQIKTTCGQCQAKDNCGTGSVAKAFSPKPNVIKAYVDSNFDLEVKVGDSVVIGIEQQFIVRSAFYVYILPIIGFVLFAGLAEVLFSDSGLFADWGMVTDLLGTIVAFFGGWLGYLLARNRLVQSEPQATVDGVETDKKCSNNSNVRLIAVKNHSVPITFHP